MSRFHGLHLPAYTYWPYTVLKLMHALVISVVRCEVSLQTDFSSSFPHLVVTTVLMFNILGSLVMSET